MNKCRLILLYACIALVFTGYLICPALAATITESPSAISTGDTVHVTFAGLNDGSSVSIRVDGILVVESDSAFSMDLTNFVMPFSLKNGELQARTEDTKKTKLSVESGESTVSMSQYSDDDGIFNHTESRAISAGTYPLIQLAGTALSNVSEVKTSITFIGTKSGVDDSELSFAVNGIENGLLTLIITVDEQVELYKPVTIGNYQTNVGTVASPDSGDNGGYDSSESRSSSQTNSGSGDENVTALNADSVSSATTSTVSSLDDSASLTGENVEDVIFLLAQTSEFPAEWKKIGSAYQLIPDRTISPHATLSFTLPAGENGIYFIAEKSGGTWNMLPSEITSDTMATEISTTGTYCLIQLNPPEIQDDTSSGTESVASNGPSSATTPAKESPISSILISGAFLSAMGLFALRINKK